MIPLRHSTIGRSSELLGLEHRPPEIHEQEHRDDARDDVIEHDEHSSNRVRYFDSLPNGGA